MSLQIFGDVLSNIVRAAVMTYEDSHLTPLPSVCNDANAQRRDSTLVEHGRTCPDAAPSAEAIQVASPGLISRPTSRCM